MDPQQTLGIAVLNALQAAGVQEIFGIPGDFVLPLFKVIEESKRLPLYTLSHEPSIGFAADGAARWHGRPFAAVVTYGAGALNTVNPVVAAYAETSPVVVISGGPGISEDHTELLLHHQAKRLDSQFEIYREVTCAQALARRGTFERIEVLLPRGSVSHTMSRYGEGLKALRKNLLSAQP